MKKLLSQLLALLLVGLAGPALAQTGPKVLFDSLHAQTAGNADWVLDEDTCGTAQRFPTPASSGITASTPETYWGGAFSAFGVDLVKKNFQVESLPKTGRISYGDSTNAQDLSNYKVFILPEPNVLLTATEKSAIISFVRNGGGLFLIVDHAGSDRNNDGKDSTVVGNDLMAGTTWGIHLQTGTEADDWFDDAPDSNYTTDASSPIVHGAYGSASAGKGLGLFGSTSMTLNPAQNATVKGHIWMTTGTVGSNSRVTFATSTDGTGRIAVIGDSSPAEDATNNCGHTTYNGWADPAYQDGLIHLNAVAWLSGGGGGGGGGDTTAPSAPSSLSATAISASQINLSWGASTDNVGVLDYDVFRSSGGSSFSVVGSTTGTSYSDTGLAASTTYSYQVKANDAANNASAASNTASATTSAGGTPAKVILNEILANEPGSDTTGEFVELVNVGGTSIGIGGWTIVVGTTTRHTFASGTTLAAGKAIVVYGGAAAIPAGLTNAVAASTGGLVLGNSGATVAVKSGSTSIDSFTYTSSLSGTDGVSMNRNPDASATGTFVLHTSISSLTSSGGKRANGTAF